MFIRGVISFLTLALLSSEAFASATVPHTLNFSGYVTDQLGTPLTTAQDMKFLLSVNGSVVWCAEYTTITATAGAISVVLGGTSQGGTALNSPASSCTSGGALTLSPSVLNSVTSATPVTLTVEINDSGSWETLATPFAISSALFALDAETLGGLSSSAFPIFNGTNQIESFNGTAVIDSNGNWIGPALNSTSSISLGGNQINNLGTPSAGTDAVNKTYDDTHVDGIAISGAVGSGQVLEYNGSNWVATSASSGTVTSVSGSAPLNVATGTTTPVISMTQSTSVASGWLSSSDWVNFESAYTTVSNTETTNKVFAAPNGSTGAPTFRALAAADIPTISGSQVSGGTFGSVNGSNLTNLNASNLSSGTVGVPELPLLIGDSGSGGTAGIVPAPAAGTAAANKFLKADGTWSVPGGGGTVTSVGLSLPAEITVTNSPVTGTGTLTGTWATETTNKVFAAPNGSTGTPSFRALVAADIPNLSAFQITSGTLPIAQGGTNSSTALNNNQLMVSSAGKVIEAGAMTNGQLLIGNTGNAPTIASLTAGSNITITPGAGTIQISASGGGSGTVTSVTGSAPLSVVTGTTTPAISISQATNSTNGYLSSADWNTFNGKQAGLTFNAPLSNSANTVSIPQATSISNGYLASGDWANFNSAFTTTSSNETTNKVFAAPNGSTGAPSFRVLAAADIPTISGSQVSGGTFGAINGSALTNLTAGNVSGSLASATIPWGNVSGAPTDLSSFTDGPGYITYGSTGTFTAAQSFNAGPYTNDWFRVNGGGGIVWQTYGGGWYMQDSTWIRSYNGKPMYEAAGFDTGAASGVGCGGAMGGGYSFQVCGTQNITGALTLEGNIYGPSLIMMPGISSGTAALISYGDPAGIAVVNDTNSAYLPLTVSTLNQSSDIRLKKNIKTLDGSLDKIRSLRGVSFDWKNSEKSAHQVGFIAQEVEKVFPEVVTNGKMGFKTVAYQNLVAPVIEAIKSLYKKITQLENRVATLESQVSRSPASSSNEATLKLENENVQLKKQNEELKDAICEINPKAKICRAGSK